MGIAVAVPIVVILLVVAVVFFIIRRRAASRGENSKFNLSLSLKSCEI